MGGGGTAHRDTRQIRSGMGEQEGSAGDRFSQYDVGGLGGEGAARQRVFAGGAVAGRGKDVLDVRHDRVDAHERARRSESHQEVPVTSKSASERWDGAAPVCSNAVGESGPVDGRRRRGRRDLPQTVRKRCDVTVGRDAG